MDVCECLWQWNLLRCYPIGDGSHRAERTPCAWGIDERECDTNNGGHYDYCPKYLAYTSPHGKSSLAPRYETQLDAEHAEDEEHHKQAETEGRRQERSLESDDGVSTLTVGGRTCCHEDTHVRTTSGP